MDKSCCPPAATKEGIPENQKVRYNHLERKTLQSDKDTKMLIRAIVVQPRNAAQIAWDQVGHKDVFLLAEELRYMLHLIPVA